MTDMHATVARLRSNSGYGRDTQRARDIRALVDFWEENRPETEAEMIAREERRKEVMSEKFEDGEAVRTVTVTVTKTAYIRVWPGDDGNLYDWTEEDSGDDSSRLF